ncbi:hypothetical protein RHMOL_Rhmol11G0000500 [Rhododendron molle]|uniref:Uncharacterized protein n=1 Tax=Rhododendron molle TaxID=49168 RepID=A0ACC0LMM6_RHOML|nr:hypothetical protein RHMOL_Rhmol11G0000500 [Rhododendron molle]
MVEHFVDSFTRFKKGGAVNLNALVVIQHDVSLRAMKQNKKAEWHSFHNQWVVYHAQPLVMALPTDASTGPSDAPAGPSLLCAGGQATKRKDAPARVPWPPVLLTAPWSPLRRGGPQQK